MRNDALVEIPLEIARKTHPHLKRKLSQYRRRLTIRTLDGLPGELCATFDGVTIVVEPTGHSAPEPAYRAVRVPAVTIPLKHRDMSTRYGIRWMSWHR